MAEHDDAPEVSGDAEPVHEHAEIHLPPPSFVPIAVSIALAVTFVGFLNQVRDKVGPTIWIIGLVLLIGSCAAWLRAARSEYIDLPESGGH
jgi:hypothetical protein